MWGFCNDISFRNIAQRRKTTRLQVCGFTQQLQRGEGGTVVSEDTNMDETWRKTRRGDGSRRQRPSGGKESGWRGWSEVRDEPTEDTNDPQTAVHSRQVDEKGTKTVGSPNRWRSESSLALRGWRCYRGREVWKRRRGGGGGWGRPRGPKRKGLPVVVHK